MNEKEEENADSQIKTKLFCAYVTFIESMCISVCARTLGLSTNKNANNFNHVNTF